MSEASGSGPIRGRMPVIFAGHGSPTNAIEDNRWSRGFRSLREMAPRPKAILAISAHWFVDGTLLTANTRPPTIHDFSGFPQPLFEIDYSAPGDIDLAEQVRQLLGPKRAKLTLDWGLDHGTWCVLRWMYPEADVPVIQLSIDQRLSVHEHFDLARSLSGLREEEILILASGNIVHNLRDAFGRKRAGSEETPAWARRFDETVKDILIQHESDALLSLWPDSDDGRQAHPTPDHWLPLIYAYAASGGYDDARFSNEGFDWGSLSMRSVVLG